MRQSQRHTFNRSLTDTLALVILRLSINNLTYSNISAVLVTIYLLFNVQ